MTYILLAGFGGGLLRGLIGFVKHQFSYKDVPFRPNYFILMMFVSGLIGLATVWSIDGIGLDFSSLSYLSPALAFTIGYAGGDFLENVYKIIVKKPSLYSNLEEKKTKNNSSSFTD
jgi:hypothetical protein